MRTFYTDYSFTKEDEIEGFDFIINHIKEYPELSYKLKDNYHDFGTYKSIEIYHKEIDCVDDDCLEYEDCICENESVKQAQDFEKLISEKLNHIL